MRPRIKQQALSRQSAASKNHHTGGLYDCGDGYMIYERANVRYFVADIVDARENVIESKRFTYTTETRLRASLEAIKWARLRVAEVRR